jgi:hypothetical protein
MRSMAIAVNDNLGPQSKADMYDPLNPKEAFP